jgi:hypothetical protein
VEEGGKQAALYAQRLVAGRLDALVEAEEIAAGDETPRCRFADAGGAELGQ